MERGRERAVAAPMTSVNGRFNELDLFRSLALAEGTPGTLIDVGAHIGTFSIAFAEMGWQVLAIEAAPTIFEELRDRTAPFPEVETVWAAVTDEEVDSVDFYLSDEHWGIHSLRAFHDSHRSRVRVPAVRLRALIEGRTLREPIYLKSDAEGADLFVLRSFDFDARRPAVVMCEFMDNRSERHFGYTHADLVSHMAAWNYSAYLSEWSTVTEYSRRGVESQGTHHLNVWRSPVAHDPAWGNLLFVPSGSERALEQGLLAYVADVRAETDAALRDHVQVTKWAENARTTIANRELKIENLEASLTRARSRIEELESAIRQRDARAARQLEAIEKLKERLSARGNRPPPAASRSGEP